MALEKDPIEAAKASKSLTMGTSSFVTGAEFTVSGFEYVAIDESDPKSNRYPAFQTSLGTLSVQSLLRAVPIKPIEVDGKLVTAKRPEGTFHDLVRKVLADNRGKTNDEVLPLLVDACKDKVFVVRDREYITTNTKWGDRARPLCHIDIKVV